MVVALSIIIVSLAFNFIVIISPVFVVASKFFVNIVYAFSTFDDVQFSLSVLLTKSNNVSSYFKVKPIPAIASFILLADTTTVSSSPFCIVVLLKFASIFATSVSAKTLLIDIILKTI